MELHQRRDHLQRAHQPKRLDAFRSAFQRATKRTAHRGTTVKVPKLTLQTIEDALTYFVHICGVGERVFWSADVSFVLTVCENITAYNAWADYAQQKAAERD